MKRRLTAILDADVVGYSRLMEIDEAGTLYALRAHRTELVAPAIARHHGRIVKLIGDGTMAEFASVIDAVTCAMAIQKAMLQRNEGVEQSRRIDFRIGIHLGDVMVEDAQRLAERARSHGVETRLELYPVATHDFHVFWSFLPEAADAVQQAGSFARDARSLTTGDRQVSGH